MIFLYFNFFYRFYNITQLNKLDWTKAQIACDLEMLERKINDMSQRDSFGIEKAGLP